jgi:acetylglutamate synthase
MSYPSKLKSNPINGLLQDSFWQSVDCHKLQSEFNGVLMGKIFVSENERATIIKLIKKTQELIKFIDSSSR